MNSYLDYTICNRGTNIFNANAGYHHLNHGYMSSLSSNSCATSDSLVSDGRLVGGSSVPQQKTSSHILHQHQPHRSPVWHNGKLGVLFANRAKLGLWTSSIRSQSWVRTRFDSVAWDSCFSHWNEHAPPPRTRKTVGQGLHQAASIFTLAVGNRGSKKTWRVFTRD